MARVRKTAKIRLDYHEIFLYVAERNLSAAEKLISSFDTAAQRIAEMPGIGARRPELGVEVRSYPVGDYLLFYRSAGKGIELLRVIHGARNLRRQFRRNSS